MTLLYADAALSTATLFVTSTPAGQLLPMRFLRASGDCPLQAARSRATTADMNGSKRTHTPLATALFNPPSREAVELFFAKASRCDGAEKPANVAEKPTCSPTPPPQAFK